MIPPRLFRFGTTYKTPRNRTHQRYSHRDDALIPSLKAFKYFIEANGDMYMGFNRMFEQSAQSIIKDYRDLLSAFNVVLQQAPSFGPIGPPIYMLIEQLKILFEGWAKFLQSPASRNVLTDQPGGWFHVDALTATTKDFPGLTVEQIFVSDPNNPSIGLMCFIAIGMTEISTCQATVEEGQRVNRGDELGMFHFGASSHALVFRPQTKIQWFDDPSAGDLVKLRSAIGGVL
ncbi:hypothetical protein PUNSTDRAFT_136447 [Punctularia strigosozonata HHB-11173 SS5]|uniref:uncharacterized protein n=1 Tax=Punctularia strigosozonata (strain HHB-11173) TaxID=741275 RepID=UPI0004418284|nr:uncharacterized protein PUNSTDRAFT_136447 [Punctularia strigosozonata HHB-11173 SS5]EIN06593.1 hypothetical protein PUNSTDRAFT_136447 [Punctularia strigosozonata HHB-11173 SS5]